MIKNSICFLIFVLVVFIACNKSADDVIQNMIVNTIDVTKYTSTDATGVSLGQIDNTDWTLDNTWSVAENALMQTPTATQLANTETAIITLYPSYPNPLNEVFHWNFRTTKPTLLQTVITDSLLNVKRRSFINTNIGQNAIAFQMLANDFANNKNYRIYYGFYSSAGGLFYKGHGDLAVRR